MVIKNVPRAFTQNIYKNGKLVSQVGSCFACSAVKVMEVLNLLNTGEYTPFSKGYFYGRNNPEWKTKEGMIEEDALKNASLHGSVPAEYCESYAEMPEIRSILNGREDINALDTIAGYYAISGYEKLKGSIRKIFDEVKNHLEKTGVPLIGIAKIHNINHAFCIVGYDGDYILWQDHDIKNTISRLHRDNLNTVYKIGGLKHMDTVIKTDIGGYVRGISTKRNIKLIQLHHTYIPSYKNFNGSNYKHLQNSMRNTHIKENGWSDIAQHFTVFPDGAVVTGRSMDKDPAGIYGANKGAVCIECLGNFDGENMADEQKSAVTALVGALCERFSLKPENAVKYHCWYTAGGTYLGDYVKGKSVKTCPGAGFFGGNTRAAFEKNLLPLLRKEGAMLKPVTEINDIVWELANAGIITDSRLWLTKCAADEDVYWLCRKIANKLRGTL